MTTAFSKMGRFSTGCLGAKGRLLLCLLDQQLLDSRQDHSILYVWDNGRLQDPVTLSWTVAATCCPGWPDAEFVAIGRRGQLLAMRPDGSTSEIALRAGSPGQTPALLRACALVEGKLYCVGGNHAVHRVAPDLRVTDVTPPADLRAAAGDTTGFETIGGFSAGEIYAAGWDGEIWRYDGSVWRQLHSPTNLVCTAMICAPDGFVYVVGLQGTVIRGREDTWEVLDLGLTADLWGTCWFGGKLYMCSMDQLFVLDENGVQLVMLPPVEPASFCRLDAIEQAMLSVGADDVCLVLADRVLKVV